MNITLGRCLVLLGTSLALASWMRADERQFSAGELTTISAVRELQLSADGTALELERGELIEDDGPASGYSYQPNEERLSRDVRARKDLLLPDPRTLGAALLIGGAGTWQFAINGDAASLAADGKAGNYWNVFRLPPERLVEGRNEFVLHGEGKLWIARDDEFAAGSLTRTRHPNRSFKSVDGGSTWRDERLGAKDDLDGEYYVRLWLDRHRIRGELTLPALDLGNLRGETLAPPLAAVPAVELELRSEGDAVTVQARAGASPAESAAGWSAWRDLPAQGTAGRRFRWEQPPGRYLQVRLVLSTTDPRRSPRLLGVSLRAEPRAAADWPRRVRVVSSHNERVARSAVPFEYEPLDHPVLRRLREQERLDEVVRGATTELELLSRLAAWSAGRWKHPGHIGRVYPAWNAAEILAPHADGQPVGGFCQQFNVVFLQACESFGFVGRAVSIGPDAAHPIRGGHEVVEIWSNDHRKWIYVDGQMAWYAVDERRVPLGLRELRERQLAAFAGRGQPVEIVPLAETRPAWKDLLTWPPFAELRLIPRSNFLAAAAPLPLNQGMRGWFWTGHHVWTDAARPADRLYSQFVRLPSQWEWTLNQAQYTVEATPEPGMFRVHLDTQTPSFASFRALLNDAERTVESGFVWSLRRGENRLAVWPINRAGRPGSRSTLVVQWDE